ncbi:MAG: flagellar basal-body MS-ring/collar protein FliF, partial [Desulfovermiculus sp.]
VNMEEGGLLSQSQVSGIVHLVAGSVQGLEPEQVTLVTDKGRVLHGDKAEKENSNLSPQNMEYRQQVESSLEDRAGALLAKAFGDQNAMVRVTADIDFTKRDTTEEVFDPDSLVPRSEKSTDKSRGLQEAGGIPGADSNLDMEEEGEGGAMPSQESSETINYEINRTVNRITKGMGDIQRLSVAVLLSEQFLSAQEGGGGAQELTQSVQRLVSSALGLRPDRGDQIEVVSMPISVAEAEEEGVIEESPTSYIPLIKYALIGLGFILIYFFLVRPIIKTLRGEQSEPYKTVEELESEYNYELEERRKQDPTEQLKKEIARSEVTPAQIVKTWLKEK